MRKTSKFFARFWRDTSGASAAEYAILLAVIAAAMAIAASQLGDAIGTAINETAQCINSEGATCL